MNDVASAVVTSMSGGIFREKYAGNVFTAVPLNTPGSRILGSARYDTP